jgi:predicted MFS family arabinose efflux permease
MLISRFIDRIGAGRAVLIASVLIALSLLTWPLGRTLGLLALVMVPWGLGCFSVNSAQQARLVGLAPPLVPASVALNSSGIYVGQAIGAAAGGWLLAHDAIVWMNWVGLVLTGVAIALSLAADRMQRNRV